MLQQTHVLSLQDYLSQLKDTDFGGTHDFNFVELEVENTRLSPKKIVSDYYTQHNLDDDDSIYSTISEYGLEMSPAPNWEDILYQVCQDLHIDNKYEDLLMRLEDFLEDGVDQVWQISANKLLYSEDYNDFYGNEDAHTMNSHWYDLLIQTDGRYFLLHMGVLE